MPYSSASRSYPPPVQMEFTHTPSHRHGLAMALSSAASIHSQDSDYSSSSKRMDYPKTDIKVNLDNHFSSKIYNSSSPISGNVTIITKRDVHFDSIEILLVGASKTVVDGVTPEPIPTLHTFLSVGMPIPASTYPSPRVLKTKETYTIPFNFVIPARLLDHACKCKTLSNELYDYHISLPPTMGSWEKNHMTPTVANVEYSIKATVCKTPPAGGRKIKIMEASQVIHVLPASREAPPMNVTQADKLYKMNTSASIRKNFLGSRLGHLEASGFQPTAVVIRPDGLGAVSSPTAHIKLTFEPKDSSSSDMALPTISKVTGKVHSYTYYSTGAIRTYPNMSSDWERQFTGERRSTYSTKVRLEPITLDDAALQWEQPNKTIARRDSGYSSDGNNNNDDDNDTTTSCGGGSTSGGSGTAPSNKNKTNSNPASSSSSPTSSSYTTTLKVPINLPTDTTLFIPTFHSCILSRVYSVELAITVAVGSASKKVKVNLPLQVVVGVAADGDQIGEGGLPSFETAVEEAAADAHLQPRVVQVPAEQFRETSSLPGYGQ